MDTMSEIFLMHLLMGLAEWTVYTAKTKWLCMASKVYVSACVFLCTLWKGFSVWPGVPVCVFHAHCEMRPEFALTDICTHKMHADRNAPNNVHSNSTRLQVLSSTANNYAVSALW